MDMNTTSVPSVPVTRPVSADELRRAVKGIYLHPVKGWVIDEPNVTTPLPPRPPLNCVAGVVQWGD